MVNLKLYLQLDNLNLKYNFSTGNLLYILNYIIHKYYKLLN